MRVNRAGKGEPEPAWRVDFRWIAGVDGHVCRGLRVVPHIDRAGGTPESITRGIPGVLRDGSAPSPDAAARAHACNGCGKCIPADPEGVTSRRMLVLANTVRAREETCTPELFEKMSLLRLAHVE